MSQGHIEHYFATILNAVRQLEAMFPDGKARRRRFLAEKTKLLALFHTMGSSAEKVADYDPVLENTNPYARFVRFTPNTLNSRKFSFGYFRSSLEELLGDKDLIQKLSLLAGEEDGKYQILKDEQQRKRDTLLRGYGDVKQKCWFTLAALGTFLLGCTAAIVALEEWLLFLLFLPPLAGSIPLGRVVFISMPRGYTVENPDTFWHQSRLDAIYSAIRDIGNENEDLLQNQKKWEGRWDHGRWGMLAGLAISAIILTVTLVVC